MEVPHEAKGDVASKISGADLRHAMGHFATGVTVVTSRNRSGGPVGTTANAVASLSLDPPLILVAFALSSTTLAAVREHGAFGINVLASHHRHLSSAFARSGANEMWTTLEHHLGETQTPFLTDAIAELECLVEDRTRAGDHEIVIGRVVSVQVTNTDARPLLFYRGAYGNLSEEP